jgi:CO/xanthine dehydrogenase Mo-binding subunit
MAAKPKAPKRAPERPYYTRDLPVPETPPPGEKPKPWRETRVVGAGLPRVDGYERVSGTAVYPSDVQLPKMLYGALLRCPYPHARVKSLNSAAAARMPGVHAVLTGRSPDAQVEWAYTETLTTPLFDPVCRFEGEVVAAVAAETPYEAWDAVDAFRVEYEELPFLVDERRALEPDAPKVHPSGNEVESETYERGDVAEGFAEADAVVEGEYRTEAELHTPVELHGCVANWDGDALTLWESTQGVYAVQAQVAKTLKLPFAKVRVVGSYVGGGFGSKLQADKATIVAALLARKAARPVKLFLTREETFLAVGNRPPSNMRVKAGAKKDGTLTALEFAATATGGAYPAGGTSLLDWQVRDLYLCPNVRSRVADLYIHGGPARPFRAPGHPQCSWALEQALDELAAKLGIDPLDLRLKNIPKVSQANGGQPYTTTGLEACLREGAAAFGWREARRNLSNAPVGGTLRRGVGLASCLWAVGGGGPPSTVVLKLFSDGSVNLNMGAADIGTGTKTIMAMVAAEELGIRPEGIQIENADTGTTQYATPSGGSKTVPTEAPAVRAAAIEVKRQLLGLAAGEFRAEVRALRFAGEEIVEEGTGRKIRLTDLECLRKQGLVVGVGYRGSNPAGKVVNPFCAQFCEVEVNTWTGEVRLLRFLSANESGRVMNRLTYRSQVIGGVTMGIGLGMTEFRRFDAKQTGKLVNGNWHDYKLPTALDVPLAIESVQVELPDDEANTAGAKGLGEPVTIPTAAAIANAVYHATGVRVTGSPINPPNLMALLSAAEHPGSEGAR